MAKFIVEGVGEFPWDRTKLSLLEAADMERATKTPINDLVRDFNGLNDPTGQRKRGMLGLAAFLWIAMRRNGHSVTFADVAAFNAEDVNETFDDETSEEPTEPDPPVPPAASRKGGSAPKKDSSRRK